MNRFQAVFVNMGVNLGGGDVGVTEHDLYGTKVGSMGKEMGGKGVAKAVGREVLTDSSSCCCLIYDLPES